MVDMMEWLEPSFSKRIECVIELCDEEAKPNDAELKAAVQHLSRKFPHITDALTEILDLHFNRQSIIEKSYKTGFLDAVQLIKKMSSECKFRTHSYPHHSHKDG